MAKGGITKKELSRFVGIPFWKAKSSYSQKEIMSSAEKLLEAGEEYFLWNEANPLQKCEAIKSGDNCGKLVTIPMMRVLTMEGLCMYLNMSTSYFRKWEFDLKQKETLTKKENELVTALGILKEAIRRQKFEGAASNLFNANLIARDLGINDTQNIHHMGNTDDSPIQMTINVHDTKAGIKTDENE